ncbi:MAG: hypothetical protein BAA01_09935 [Bacillus thermozeamaize]|uniref:Uncharacterized protein n=1 Tax=Bacillus thermozeamaize TaxID=230954 RepID=A0A1Y3PMD8_9BACI|nr:MAG: hypothetical protein BAA01_09935 [Bacillus thermozeamaize]
MNRLNLPTPFLKSRECHANVSALIIWIQAKMVPTLNNIRNEELCLILTLLNRVISPKTVLFKINKKIEILFVKKISISDVT